MSAFEPGLRRTPDPGPPPSESVPALVERIRTEIAAGGPITFARFMELALYDPQHGYYRTGADRPTRAGDFLTAPELHPIFGAALARQLDELWERLGRPAEFVLREYGAGTGTLGLTVLVALEADGSGLARALRYQPLEIDRGRASAIAGRLAAAGFGAALDPGHDAGEAEPIVGAVVANEFLDALPVHRVEGRDGGLAELYVAGAGDGFVERAGPPSTPALAARLAAEGIGLLDGQQAEVNLGVDDWVAEVAAALRRGAAFIIDYGYPATELYGPGRPTGTLRAYAGHRVHADPFAAIGRQDLTAHLDLTALERAALDGGLELIGRTSQAEFLVGCGLESLLETIRSDPATTIEAWLAVRSAVARLIDPAAMGRFAVVVVGRDLPAGPPLRGLAYRFAPRAGAD